MPRRLHSALVAAALLAAAAGAAFEVDEATHEVVIKSLAGFDKCVLDLSETPACLDALRRYASKRPNDAFQAGKRARMHYQPLTALPFFEIAFRKKATDAQCGDEDVLLAITAALAQPAAPPASVEAAKDIAVNKCWDELQESLIEAAGQAEGDLKTNLCLLLSAKDVSTATCQAAER
jgi:hypothetical protein